MADKPSEQELALFHQQLDRLNTAHPGGYNIILDAGDDPNSQAGTMVETHYGPMTGAEIEAQKRALQETLEREPTGLEPPE